MLVMDIDEVPWGRGVGGGGGLVGKQGGVGGGGTPEVKAKK